MEKPLTHHSRRQRLTALVYGLACHAAFAAAVMLMAFSLFTGLRHGRGPFHGWGAVMANTLLLAAFPLAHSWLLTRKGRRFMAALVPLGIGSKISMTVFATISSLQLLAAFALWSPSGIIWWQAGPGMQIIIGFAAMGGWLLLGRSMSDAQLDLQLGLVGWWAVFRNRKAVYKPFATHGLYRHVRQPIYISFALLLWLSSTWTPDQLVLALSWTGYCVVGSVLKERRFIRYFGEAFRAYQRRVPFWFPGLPKNPVSVRLPAVKTDTDILIIGAGPVGLLLANLLGRRGLRVLVAELRTLPPKGSMAIGITPPSLDILKTLSLDREFINQGIPITRASVFENGGRLGDVDFSRLPSQFRCILSLPQSKTVSILRQHLSKYPSVTLLEGTRFLQRTEEDAGVRVLLQDVASAAISEFTARYLVGCDGTRSAVRNLAQIPFPGRSYPVHFFMADFPDTTTWGAEARLYFGSAGSVEAFPLTHGQRRWIIQAPRDARPEESMPAETVAREVLARTGIDLVKQPGCFESWFRPQRRLARTYHRGRVLLCGDAAHVMSPIGGQGMNTGFADAAHLDRALAAAITAPETAGPLFAEYTRTRRRAFRIAAGRAARGMWLGTRRGPLPSLLRCMLIGHVLLRPTIRERMAPYFAMLTIPGNPIQSSTGKATAP